MNKKRGGKGRGPAGKGKGKPRAAAVKLDPETKAEMRRLMEEECLRKPAARRIATGELTLDDFKLNFPQEYAISYRAKNLIEQHAGMTRARAFWLAEEPGRIEEMRDKQIRTFATQTGLSYEISRDIATGKTSLAALAEKDERWAFIWTRAKARIKARKELGENLSPMDAIRWARGDSGLPLSDDEDEANIEELAQKLHDEHPYLKKRHARRMARFGLSVDELAAVSPANCGWAPRAKELWARYPTHHRKFVRLMAMMGLSDAEAADFVERTEPAREKYRELAKSDRRFYFQLYETDRVAQLVADDNPFAWRLIADADKGEIKQSKLHVLHFCVAEAKDAIYNLLDYDVELMNKKLGPAFKADERLEIDIIEREVEKAKKSDRQLRLTLRNGQIFTGNLSWASPFELQLRLSNNAWVLVLFHAIYKIETL